MIKTGRVHGLSVELPSQAEERREGRGREMEEGGGNKKQREGVRSPSTAPCCISLGQKRRHWPLFTVLASSSSTDRPTRDSSSSAYCWICSFFFVCLCVLTLGLSSPMASAQGGTNSCHQQPSPSLSGSSPGNKLRFFQCLFSFHRGCCHELLKQNFCSLLYLLHLANGSFVPSRPVS